MAQRLQKSEHDRVLFGVCGGLGDYFSLDPVLVRVVFVVLTFASGLGLLAYLLLAIIMPRERTGGAPAASVIGQNVAAMPREAIQAARQAGEALQGALRPSPAQGAPAPEPPPAPLEPTQATVHTEREEMRRPAHNSMRTTIAVILIAAGALFLASNLGLFSLRWDFIWPVILIGLGVAILAKRARF